MSQDDQFHKYGYNHYLKAPKRPKSDDDRCVVSVRSRLMRRFQSPVLATIALVFAAVFFVIIIILAYPDNDDKGGHIPIIKADLRPIKSIPLDSGGMAVPYSDSTIMANIGVERVDVIDDVPNIEYLLEKSSDDLVSKEEAIDLAMSQNPIVQIIHSPDNDILNSVENIASDVTNIEEIVAVDKSFGLKETNDFKPDFDVKEPSAKDILQKIGSSSPDVINGEEDVFDNKVALAAMSFKPDVKKISVARTSTNSNETIDFVRSILGDKDHEVSSVEPAAGLSGVSAKYYVQLASIKDSSRAKLEWIKMQKRYSSLSSLKYRVQEAYLSSGKFYRIQAGPISKSQASEVCKKLKEQNKPGGCLVVK